MLIRAEDFEAHAHPVLSEPELPDEMKLHFKELGLAATRNNVECLEIVDECFHCGEKLTTPYIYWQGDPRSISLHPKCAMKLALGLVQDTHEAANGKRAESERQAAIWLELFVSKKASGLEAEEFTSP